MKKYFLIFIGFLILKNLSAQNNFERIYGEGQNDEATDVIRVDNSYYLVGKIDTSNSGTDASLIKTDLTGSAIWTKKFVGVGLDKFVHIEKTTDKNLIICGYTSSFGNGGSDGWIIKVDTLGNIIWQKNFGGIDSDMLYCVKEMPDSGYFAVGETSSFGLNIPSPNMYLIRTNKFGDTLWTKVLDYAGANEDKAQYTSIMPNGSIIVSGYSSQWESTYFRRDVRLISLAINGNVQWSKTYNTILPGDWEDGFNVFRTMDKGIIICGSYSSIGWNYGYLMKTDSMGNHQWYTQLSGGIFGGENYAKSVALTSDSGYVVTGNITEAYNLTGDPIAIWKCNKLGTIEWVRSFGGTLFDLGQSIKVDSDKCFYVAGLTSTKSIFGQNDQYLLKVDSLGYFSPKVWTSPDLGICEGDSITIYAYSNYDNPTFNWMPSTNIIGSSTENPLVFPSSTQTYSVTSIYGGNTFADSVRVNVYPLPHTPVITYNAGVLCSNAPSGNQWFLNGSAISGANSNFYTPQSNGLYYVIVTNNNGCISDTSNNITAIINQMKENTFEGMIQVYPNPAKERLVLKRNNSNPCVVEIVNTSGEIVKRFEINEQIFEIDINCLSNGIYSLRITNKNSFSIRRFIKQ